MSVTLTGSLTPGGFDTHYHFQWGSSTSYGNQTPIIDAGEGPGGLEVQAALANIAPNTTYHYRLVAENQFGETAGGDRAFTTSGPARITEEAPTGLEHQAAILHARVDPDQLATTYRFVYGESTAYGSESPLGGASIGEGSTPVAVEATLTNLKIGTVYHYRVIAENKAGKSEGPDEVFETVPPAPITEATPRKWAARKPRCMPRSIHSATPPATTSSTVRKAAPRTPTSAPEPR